MSVWPLAVRGALGVAEEAPAADVRLLDVDVAESPAGRKADWRYARGEGRRAIQLQQSQVMLHAGKGKASVFKEPRSRKRVLKHTKAYTHSRPTFALGGSSHIGPSLAALACLRFHFGRRASEERKGGENISCVRTSSSNMEEGMNPFAFQPSLIMESTPSKQNPP